MQEGTFAARLLVCVISSVSPFSVYTAQYLFIIAFTEQFLLNFSDFNDWLWLILSDILQVECIRSEFYVLSEKGGSCPGGTSFTPKHSCWAYWAEKEVRGS